MDTHWSCADGEEESAEVQEGTRKVTLWVRGKRKNKMRKVVRRLGMGGRDDTVEAERISGCVVVVA